VVFRVIKNIMIYWTVRVTQEVGSARALSIARVALQGCFAIKDRQGCKSEEKGEQDAGRTYAAKNRLDGLSLREDYRGPTSGKEKHLFGKTKTE